MSIPRFFMEGELPEGDIVTLPFSDKELHHLAVRRIREGEHIAAVAAGGKCWEVEIETIDEFEATGSLHPGDAAREAPRPHARAGHLEGRSHGATIRRTTELGIGRIIPFLSARTVVRLAVDERGRKGSRWRRIALSAAKQSGRNILPIVEDPTGLDDICRELAEYDRVVIAWEEADKRADGTPLSVTDALEGCDIDSHVALVIGPEGGLTAEEVEAIKSLGSFVKIVSLGELILRTETAGTVATALCMYTLGGLGNHS